jgi:hypothetical protein
VIHRATRNLEITLDLDEARLTTTIVEGSREVTIGLGALGATRREAPRLPPNPRG